MSPEGERERALLGKEQTASSWQLPTLNPGWGSGSTPEQMQCKPE